MDTDAASDPRFRLDTPEGFSAGQMLRSRQHHPNHVVPDRTLADAGPRTHFKGGSVAPAEVLKDPLWFAAKYGGFKDANNNGTPDEGEWDTKVVGSPDNYFLVTNALGLKAQLQSAFNQIIADSQPVGSAAASGARYVPFGTLAYQAKYLATDWTGDLKAFPLNSDGSLGALDMGRKRRAADSDARNIFTSKATGSPPSSRAFHSRPAA